MTTRTLPWLMGLLLLLGGAVPYGQDVQLRPVEIPNDERHWQRSGFVEMVPPLRLPTDTSNDNLIKVWLKVPEGRAITVKWLDDQKRYTLSFPPGTVADRVETMRNERKAMLVINGIEDVRGATIDDQGRTLFHVYEPVPGDASGRLRGYEWLRTDNQSDDRAADELIKLYYPGAGAAAQVEAQGFRRLNQCGRCHQPNQAAPSAGTPRVPGTAALLTDSHGFFQPLTVLEDTMLVRSSRKWDLNADDPLISVWCGTRQTRATTNGDRRGYVCPDGAAPIGRLDMPAALKRNDPHARQVCESRRYLYRHMDQAARDGYRSFFAECAIN